MNDDVGTIDSDSDTDKDGSLDTKEKLKETKPSISGLPMDDASDAWMNDDVGTIDSDSEQDTDDDNNKESNSNLVQKIQNTKPPFNGLPMNDASEAWMDYDFETIES